ncbi:jg14752 [Pararge aegeria aegeria]|uniref:Jg14752 protein n=1 Tax=Pararge aegeria aegeria TaxID=348720 RepID=A0A8S4SNM7_9NEOP|nr:jg14752 [Pararge aegeria aegeria]
MTGATRICDPHSATVRAIKPVYVKNFNSSARVTTGRAFLAASPARKKRSAPGAQRKCTARELAHPPP